MPSGVMPASVSRPRLGSEAITLLRSTKPGRVRPMRLSSSLAARTPLMAMNAMCNFGLSPTLCAFWGPVGCPTRAADAQRLRQAAPGAT